MAMIEIKNISKWYGNFQVLKDCSVDVEKGEVVVVCGPSGSGKSTLIKTVNALEPFQKGEIIVDSTTKDTEIIKLTKDPEEYFAEEVYPHVPDAIWCYEFDPSKKESATNKEKQGAEFPFTRFFYEYKVPESADDLLAQFMELEKSLTAKIAQL